LYLDRVCIAQNDTFRIANPGKKFCAKPSKADTVAVLLVSNQQNSNWRSDMNQLRVGVLLSTLAIGLGLTGCGGGSSRQLVSIALSPNPAAAKNGTVQLVATGTFNSAPLTVTPLAVNWSQSNCLNNACPTAEVIGPISVNQGGVASCAQGYSGTAVVHASAPRNPSQPTDATGVPLITGTTSVVCP
jgi:hypothetical protein